MRFKEHAKESDANTPRVLNDVDKEVNKEDIGHYNVGQGNLSAFYKF